jgi:3-(3-hydroxy-phenyl)propionate hydroxylase
MSRNTHYEVVIVGFGPAGAVAACWLGQMGVKTLVVEKSRTIWDISRAIALDHEILRVFQNIGVVEQVLAHAAPFGASEHYGVEGQLIRRIDVTPPPYPMGYSPNMAFTQPPVERILRDRAQEHGCVTVSLGSELTNLTDEGGMASVTIKSDQGAESDIHTNYVVACDGASSTVRRMLKLPLADLGFDEPWLVVDVLVNEDALPKLPKVCAQYCDPARPYTYIMGPGNHRRWEIMLSPGENPREQEREDSVWRLLSRWLEPADGRLWRASSYRFHALVAETWRKGRTFIAGDAAHQQPPFLGQGMCQGIRDVTNLCWRLKSVLHEGWADSLLDSYEQERKEHVTTLTKRIKEIGAAICIRDADAARKRDEDLLRRGGGRAWVVTRQEIVPPLTTGLIRNSSGPAAGSLFPQPRIAFNGGVVLLDERAGSGWRLMIDGRRSTYSPETVGCDGLKAVVIGGNGFDEMDGVAAKWFDTFACHAAIVRPDQYVYCGFIDPRSALQAWHELRAAI